MASTIQRSVFVYCCQYQAASLTAKWQPVGRPSYVRRLSRALPDPEDRCWRSAVKPPRWLGLSMAAALPYRRQPCYPAAMIYDLVTALLVAFAAVTASEVLTRIWESL